MKLKFVNLYRDIARRVAELSTARRLQVGAIIVKDDRIVSIGYNGMPAGWDNNCEEWVDLTPEERIWSDADRVLRTRPEVLHAERNALDKLAKSGGTGAANSSMFITHAPCLECAKSIYGAGITEVFYSDEYRSRDGIYFLQKCGVKIEKI